MLEIVDNLLQQNAVVTFMPLDEWYPFQPVTREWQQKGVEVLYGINMNIAQYAKDRKDFYTEIIVSRSCFTSDLIEKIKKRASKYCGFYRHGKVLDSMINQIKQLFPTIV